MSIRVTRDILSLVMDKPPSIATMKKWSAAKMRQAEKWAATEHALANDHRVRRIPMPDFLKPKEAHHG